jgi:GTPase SAR1 family protein
MKTVLLIGPCNCGKTTTMNLVCDKISSQGKFIEPKEHIEGACETDFRCVIEYKTKTIALFSMGDFFRKVTAKIKASIEKKYDILVICCNDGFKSLDKLIKNYDCEVVRKSKEKEPQLYQQANMECCEKIVETVDSIIDSLTTGGSK